MAKSHPLTITLILMLMDFYFKICVRLNNGYKIFEYRLFVFMASPVASQSLHRPVFYGNNSFSILLKNCLLSVLATPPIKRWPMVANIPDNFTSR